MSRVFISHSSRDCKFIESTILPVLRAHGIDTWYSKEDINGFPAWETSIKQALMRCDWFMVMVSPNAAESEWVKDEVHWAVSNRKNRVIPVLIDDVDPFDVHIRLPRIQSVDYRTPSQEAAAILVSAFEAPEAPITCEQQDGRRGPYEEEVSTSPTFPGLLAKFDASSANDSRALVKTLAMAYRELRQSRSALLGGAESIDQFLEMVSQRCDAKLLKAIELSYGSCRSVLRFSQPILRHRLFSEACTAMKMEDERALAIALAWAYDLVPRMKEFQAVDSIDRFLRICAKQNDCRHNRLWNVVHECLKVAKGFRGSAPEKETDVSSSPRFSRLAAEFQASSEDDRSALAKAIATAYWAFQESNRDYLRGAEKLDEFLEVIDERCDAKLREAILVSYRTALTINHYSRTIAAAVATDKVFSSLSEGQSDEIKQGLADGMALAYRGVRAFPDFQAVDSIESLMEVATSSDDCRHERLKKVVVDDILPAVRGSQDYF